MPTAMTTGCRQLAPYTPTPADAATESIDLDRSDAPTTDVAADLSSDLPSDLSDGPSPDSGPHVPSLTSELFLGDDGHFIGKAAASAIVNGARYVAFAGTLRGTLALSGSCPTLVAQSQQAAAVLVFSENQGALSCQWAAVFDATAGLAAFTGVAIDATSKRVSVAGHTEGPIDLGGGLLPHPGGQDALFGAFELVGGKHLTSAAWGASGNDQAFGVAVDPASGDALVVGTFSGSVNFGGKVLVASPSGNSNAFVLRAKTTANTVTWAATAGPDAMISHGLGVAVLGDVWVVGHAIVLGKSDVLLSRHLLSSGTQSWHQTYGTPTQADLGTAIAADPINGLIAFGGYSYGDLSFGVPLTAKTSNTPRGFVVVAKPSSTAPIMQKGAYIEGGPNSVHRVYAMGFSEGQAIACGEFKASIDGATATMNAQAARDGFCLGYPATGDFAPAWDQLFLAGGDESVGGVAISGNKASKRYLAVAGHRTGTAELDLITPTPSNEHWIVGSHELSQGEFTRVAVDPSNPSIIYAAGLMRTGLGAFAGRGGDDGFVARYDLDQNGTLMLSWIKAVGGKQDDRVDALTVGPSGEVYIAGSFTGSATVGHASTYSIQASTNSTVAGFVARLEGTGETTWAHAIGGTLPAAAKAVVVSGTEVVVAGTFTTGLTEPTFVAGKAKQDVFVLWFTASGGTYVRSWTLAGQEDEHVGGLMLDANNQPVIFGSFSGLLDFGIVGEPQTAADTKPSGFVVGLDGSGKARWKTVIAGDGVVVNAGQTTSGGKLQLAGSFANTLVVDGKPVASMGAGSDGFMLQLDSNGALVPSSTTVFPAEYVSVAGLTRSADGEAVLVGTYRGATSIAGLGATAGDTVFALVGAQNGQLPWTVTVAKPTPTTARSAAYAGKRLLVAGFGTRTLGGQPWLALLQ